MKRIVFAFLIFASSVFAGSGSFGGGGGVGTMTVTWTTDSSGVHYHIVFACSTVEPGGYTNQYIYVQKSLDNFSTFSQVDTQRLLGNQPPQISFDGTQPLPAGTLVRFKYQVDSKANYAGTATSATTYSSSVGAPVFYKITFHIPGNTTEHVVSYRMMQNDEQVGEYSQLPRAAGLDVTLDGLESNSPVTLIEFQQKYKFVDIDGVTHVVPTGETQSRSVGSGVPTIAGSVGSSSGGPGSGPPIVNAPPSIPNAPNVGPKTPSPPPPAPDHKAPPNLPSGAGGATKEDIEKQTNDIIDGLNKVIDNNAAGSGAVVDAINDLKTSNGTDANAIIDAVNGVKDGTGQVASSVAETNGLLQGIAGRLTGTDGRAGDSGAGDGASAAAAASSAPSYSGPAVTGNMGSGAGVTFTTASAVLPGPTLHVGDRDITIGAAPAFMDSFLAILVSGRALLLLALCVWFVHSCSESVQGYVIGLSQAGTGGMSTVTGALDAVPGASLAKHLASSTAVVVVILAACAAIVALVDVAGARFGLTLANLFNAFDMTSLGPGIGWLDHYVPVGASISFCVLRAGMPYLAAPLYLAASTTARFLHL